MNEINCERICMAAMARADGYRSELQTDQIEAHLASCTACRQEVDSLQELAKLLDVQERRQHTDDLWQSIGARLAPVALRESAANPRRAFAALGMALIVYKLVEMIPSDRFGLFMKIVPVLAIIAVFVYLRENPFAINAELRLEGKR